jgi:hypothetical protein
VVISQVYGGGGNAGATLKNDFIELFNRGSAAVDVTGWSVQYASSTGTTWQVTSLLGPALIPPGQYYLIQEGAGTGGTVDLPTPDRIGSINMSGTAGKVALVNSVLALSGACPVAGVQDFVGYGTANCSETSPTPLLSNTTAALRAGLGCTDTDNNAADFAAGAPNPRNSASPATPCVGPLTITTSSPLPQATVNQPYGVTFAASGGTGTGYVFSQAGGTLPPGLSLTDAALSGTPTTTTGSPFTFTIQVTDSGAGIAQKVFQLAVDPAPVCNPTFTIAEIQGSGDTSPQAGHIVTTSGIVTGVKSNGFFIQMADPGDGDPTTSDGVFVFTSSVPPATAAVGSDVCVIGTVQEFIPGADPFSPAVTEIGFVSNTFRISTGNPLPPAVGLTAADTDPGGGIDQLEKYEGMRVHVDSLTVSAPTQGSVNEPSATSTSNGVFYGVITGAARPFREPGIEAPDPLPLPGIPRFDGNPERLRVDTDGLVGAMRLEVTSGAVVTGLTGPLDYSFRTYTIDPDPATPPIVTGNIAAVPLADPGPTKFTVAAYNVERFFDTVNDADTDDAVLTPTAFNERLNKLSLVVRDLMRTPDILGLEEVENLTTLQSIAEKINADAVAAGDADPDYVAYLEEGNDIGGIDVGFLVKSSRIGVLEVTQIGKDATYINPNNSEAELLNDRPSLLIRALVSRPEGATAFAVTVIVSHLRSLSGVDDPDDGNRVRTKRRAQAEFLADFVQSRQAASPGERLILVGDFNAFQFNDGYVDSMGTIKGTPTPASQVTLASSDVVNPDLVNLVETVPASERYSFTFDGNAQVLDHVLVSANLLGRVAHTEFVRTDADFPESLRNDPTRPERVSDHDPIVATFNLPAVTRTLAVTDPNPSDFLEPVTVTATVTSGGNPVTEGTVRFLDGSTEIAGPVALNAEGQASFSTSELLPGLHGITATYSGSESFVNSNFTTVHEVGTAPSQTVIVSSSNPSGFGQLVTFTATVTFGGRPVTGGLVQFTDGAAVLTNPIELDGAGRAVFATSGLSVGSHTITAHFAGTGPIPGSSGSVVQTVVAGLSVSDAFVLEGNTEATVLLFRVRLTPASATPVTVNVATADGSALAGSDYAAVHATLTFPPGVNQRNVLVPVAGDGTWEEDETLTLRLTGATNAGIADGEGVGTILNDDPLPAVQVGNVLVSEGDSGTMTAFFQVTLSAPSSRPVTVNLATADGTAVAGSDYTSFSGSLTIPAGTVRRPVAVSVQGDLISEPHEFFFLQATGATNAVIGNGRGIGIILNDDLLPLISVFDASTQEPVAGTVNMTFFVRLSAPSSQTVTVHFATADGTAVAGSDYVPASGILVFPPFETIRGVAVTVLADGEAEPTEEFTVNLSLPTNGQILRNSGVGLISDAGASRLSVSP